MWGCGREDAVVSSILHSSTLLFFVHFIITRFNIGLCEHSAAHPTNDEDGGRDHTGTADTAGLESMLLSARQGQFEFTCGILLVLKWMDGMCCERDASTHTNRHSSRAYKHDNCGIGVE